MKRRTFVQKSAGIAALSALPLTGWATAQPSEDAAFQLNYAPHFGMFGQSAGKDVLDQLRFIKDRGFRSLEDNGMGDRPVAEQQKIADLMTKLGLDMGVFVVNATTAWRTTMASGKKEDLDTFLDSCRKAVEVAKRVNAKWMTVVPGYFDRDLPMGIQTANVLNALRRASEIFEPHGLVMVLEPLSDNADLFLRFSSQTFEICKAVDSPSCKILFDIYHMQKNEGHLIYHMDLAWEEIAYIQIGDNPGRNEPTTGEVNYKNVFKHIHEKGYKGILGMEHGNSISGKEGETALIKAYREVDSF